MNKLKETLAGLYDLLENFFTSKDMKALYWTAFAQLAASGLDILLQNLTDWDPNNLLTIFVGLIIARITKKLNKPFYE